MKLFPLVLLLQGVLLNQDHAGAIDQGDLDQAGGKGASAVFEPWEPLHLGSPLSPRQRLFCFIPLVLGTCQLDLMVVCLIWWAVTVLFVADEFWYHFLWFLFLSHVISTPDNGFCMPSILLPGGWECNCLSIMSLCPLLGKFFLLPGHEWNPLHLWTWQDAF